MADSAIAPKSRLLVGKFRRAAHRLRAAASPGGEAKYDPDQPRVPAGNSDGGQWTGGGGGAGRASASGGPRSRPRSRKPEDRDEEAAVAWRQVRREALVDGSGERAVYEASDGTRIVNERRTSLITGARTSRQAVLVPDGGGIVGDNDRFGIQRIYDSDGKPIAATRWGPNGPEPVAVAELAFSDDRPPKLPRGKVGLVLRGGLALWNLLNSQRKPDKVPVIVARRPRVYTPSKEDSLVLQQAGELDQDKADEFCTRYPEVRRKLSEIARQTRFGFTGDAKTFGALVHLKMADYVKAQNDLHFRAEVTDTQGKKIEGYSRKRYKGSTFLDVYERVSEETVCIYVTRLDARV